MAVSTIKLPVIRADYVIETGTYGLWTWRKWNSGIAECWGTYSARLTHYYGGNGFYGYTTNGIDLPPGLFNATPTVTADGIIGDGFYLGSLTSASSTYVNISVLSTASNWADCTFHMQLIGRWQ